MRKLVPFLLVLVAACATTPSDSGPQSPADKQPGGPYGLTVAEEATILALEDRRQYDPVLFERWSTHPNPLHRLRIALAMARIGPHAFPDENEDGSLSRDEVRAGVRELMKLASDPDRKIRETVAFALGEIGERRSIPALVTLFNDPDLGVAAEAAEAFSKFGADRDAFSEHLPRYLWLTDEKWPEGPRARAVRFLFRFEDPEALAANMRALASPSSAVREAAAYSFARKPHATAGSQLALLLTDPNVLTRAYAITALGRIGEPAPASKIVAALGDAHPWVRTNAAIALGRLAEKNKSVLRAEDLPRVFAALEDPDPGVRASMIETLAYYAAMNETAHNRLIQLFSTGSQWERELTALAVAKHLPNSYKYVPRATFTPWQCVRFIEGTAAIAYGPIARAQYATHADAMVRATAIGAIPDDRADLELDLIRAALTDSDVVVRANAYDRYGRTTVDSANVRFTTLRDAEVRERKAEMNDGRLAAISAIGAIGPPNLAEYLMPFLSDSDPVVRRVVSDLLFEKTKVRHAYTPLPVNRKQAEYEEIVRWSRNPHTATIHMTRGSIELALLTQDAPMTTWNFAQLAKKGYFDNSSFMRVVPNFVIQGGDPRNDMNGGPGYAIRDEINLQKYTRGAVGMALSGPDTGGSQFFVTHSPQPHLDGGYTIFGRVYDGMSGVVDQTERGDRVQKITIDERPPATPEQVSSIPNVSLPLLVGEMSKDALLTTVPDYVKRKSEYQPDVTVLEMMKPYVGAADRVEVFMGTWCSDSQREVPKFLRILDDLEARFDVRLPVEFFALDRSKQKPESLLAGKSVQKVATFIYYRGDEELGRIVEKPVAVFEDDLLAIMANGQKSEP